MYQEFVQLGNNVVNALLAVPPSVYGLVIGSAGLATITFFVNKFIKVYTEITSSKVFAGVFLAISLGINLVDYLATNGQFHLVGYGKTSALLIGGATALYHGIRIARAVIAQIAYYAPLIGTKAQAVRASIVSEPVPVNTVTVPTSVATDELTVKHTGAF